MSRAEHKQNARLAHAHMRARAAPRYPTTLGSGLEAKTTFPSSVNRVMNPDAALACVR